MEWLTTSIYWWFMLFVIGFVFFPLTRRLFSDFHDAGYAFAKIIGIVVLTYFTFILGILHLVAFSTGSLVALLILASLGGFHLRKKGLSLPPLKVLIGEEILIGIVLIGYMYIRGQEPSIHGLEKFMDFGFMNSILRSSYFPPLDIWYGPDTASPAGYALNYYYFGHMMGAVLIKLSRLLPSVGYNLILGTICSLGVIQTFSLVTQLTQNIPPLKDKVIKKSRYISTLIVGLLGAYLLNFGGNLHTIYLFTKGYPNDHPVPFWGIFSWFNTTGYWYPNATRFIEYTIHEFPAYSYVVADLHGHVFDIPVVLLTLALLYQFMRGAYHRSDLSNIKYAALFGTLTAVHFMTNAFDGPIYFLLIALSFVALFGLTRKTAIHIAVSGITFVIAALPFTLFFKPFASGVGINCGFALFQKAFRIGPLLVEPGNCQISPLWMLFVLWGFFTISLALCLYTLHQTKYLASLRQTPPFLFCLILFAFGHFLLLIPEFFYIKDIYPAHFRANTMFKMGYQAFMMMSIASALTFYMLRLLPTKSKFILKTLYLFFFFFVFIYPFFAFTSYYGQLKKVPQLDGARWLALERPADFEIVSYINNNIKGQPIILEAQGDSYTDYERISAYTGLPTVAGWLVHEWLWRGSADYVGKRAPDISTIYESSDLATTRTLLNKYQISYVIVSGLEREKYPNLRGEKFDKLGKKIFESKDRFGALYSVK